jgi:signal transduction histidine kinase
LTLFVAAVALASVAVLSRLAVRSEYLRFETRERAGRLSGVATLLGGELGAAATPEQVDARLRAWATSLGQALVLLGPDGSVIGASTPALRSARFQVEDDGRLSIEQRELEGGVLRVRRLVVVGGPRAAVAGPAGVALGTLHALPGHDGDEAAGFVTTVNRWLFLAALGSGVLALLISLALSRRILGPVEALTAAARRMGAGDLGQRVPDESADEIGELARTFNAMAEGLQRTEALRRTLVADVAHELRTPLTNLRCQIEALQDGLQPADEEALRSLHEETLLLSRLVSDLQDLALAESGQLPLHRGPVAVREAVEAALTAVRPVARARGVLLREELDGDCVVDADRERLGQVLRNLLANAVTHTPGGGTVAVAARATGHEVVIEVRDTGSGIPPEHLAHVFDRFYRGDPSRSRATGGAGLGLAIVKQLVEAHGGTVTAESAPEEGARFTVRLPAPRA